MRFDVTTENIVTAWAECTGGPGWVNWPIWVLVQTKGTSDYRVECLQVEEQTEVLRALHRAAAAMSVTVRTEVIALLALRKEGEEP